MMELTNDQKRVLVELLNGNDYCVSVLGSAGTGKTALIREYVKQCPHDVKVCAYTGVAAALHDEGMTLHSMLAQLPKNISKALAIEDFRKFLEAKGFGFFQAGRLSPKQHSLLSYKYQEYLDSLGTENDNRFYEFIEMVSVRGFHNFVLVIDESSMIPKRMMEMMLRLFKFKKLVLVGDKYQIAPVSEDKGYCYSILPTETIHLEMSEVVRQKDSDVLTALRNAAEGTDQEENIKFLNRYFVRNFDPFKKEDIRIYYTNADKDAANERWLRNSPTVSYYPKVHFCMKWDEIVPNVKWLSKCQSHDEAKEEIIKHYHKSLRAGIVTVPASGSVMCLRNQRDRDSGEMLANGHIAELRDAKGGKASLWTSENGVQYRYDDNFHYKDLKFPVMASMKPFHQSTAPYFLMVYPALQPAYAFTYHKTQGMTIEPPRIIGVYVPSQALDFSGLMYVALTRCRDFAQINLHGKLAKEHFQYNHDELDADRMVDNTIALLEEVKAG